MKSFFKKAELELICQKGVYQYEYIDSDGKFEEEGLPPRKAFYSKLKLSGISKRDYQHANNVYDKFNCKTFQDYHDLSKVGRHLS